MDIADRAQRAEALGMEMEMLRIGRQRNEGPGRIACEDCGEVIPRARREAQPGCTRCVRCQELFERG